MAISVSIDTKQLMSALKELPKNIQKNVMVGATRAGAVAIAEEAKLRVPVDTGDLKKSIGVTRRKGDVNIVRFSISPRKGKGLGGWYAHFVEFGTSKQPAQPFMRPAYENSSEEALKRAGEYLKSRLPYEVAKARK